MAAEYSYGTQKRVSELYFAFAPRKVRFFEFFSFYSTVHPDTPILRLIESIIFSSLEMMNKPRTMYRGKTVLTLVWMVKADPWIIRLLYPLPLFFLFCTHIAYAQGFS